MRRHVILGVALVFMGAGLGFLASCGGDSEQQTAGKPGNSLLQTISDQALSDIDINEEAPELKAKLESAGYQVSDYVEFASQESGTSGRMLLYADKKGQKGGLIYFKKPSGNVVRAEPAWHWHFDDLAPTAVSKHEFNEDGLWDLRVETTTGETLEMIQDEMFTFMGKERPGFVAMNGRCSAPADINSMMWLSFDGDTVTAWRSPLDSEGGAFLEVDTPFGIAEGMLVLRSHKTDQPSRGKVMADGKEIASFELMPDTGKQMVELGQGALDVRTIRIDFEAVHGGGRVVAVAELEVR